MLTVPPTKACLLCITPTGLDLYTQVHAQWHLLSAVLWISEDRLFMWNLMITVCVEFDDYIVHYIVNVEFDHSSCGF